MTRFKIPWLDSLPARRRKLVLWAAGLLLFYTVFGFLVLPLIVRAVAVKQLGGQLERKVTIRKVLINPFMLSGAIRGLRVEDLDGGALLSWEEVYGNFQLASFFGRPWVFKEVRVAQPFARAQVNKDCSLNFSDLVAKFSRAASNAPPAKPGKPLALRVDRLRIEGARALLADLTPREPFRRVIGPLEITLTGFHTHPDNKNPYGFTGTTDSGEKISWSGHFYLDPIRSEGEFALENLALARYAPLYQDLVRFEIRDGVIDARTRYRFEKSAATNVLLLTNSGFALRSLKVAEKGRSNDLAQLDSLTVREASLDVMPRRAEIASIALAGGRVAVSRDADAAINLIEVSKPAETATNAPGGILVLLRAATNAFSLFLNSTSLWSATLHEFSVTNCSAQLEDLVNRRPVRLAVEDIALTARNLSNTRGTNITASLALRWNTNGTVKADVTGSILPPSAEARLAVDQLELRPVDPYLEEFVDVFVLNSKVGLGGTLRLRMANDALPDVTFTGDARLDDFATADAAQGEDLLKWSALRVDGIEARLHPPAVAVRQIALRDLTARVVMETNQSLNVLTALRLGDTNAPLLPLPGAKKPAKGKDAKPAPVVASPSAMTNALPLPPISIASVALSNATILLHDRSLLPNVRAAIRDLNGAITGVSTDPAQTTQVAFTGKVDGTGPFEITGRLKPQVHALDTDLKVLFTDVDLHPSGPYAGKFLGHRLNKGKLALELNYEIRERKLKSKNVIRLDQFTLGEKVASPDATKLPVKLAIAVLKDRQGRIELDVPIEGSIDDPQFRLGKVITRAVVNVITKIVTSPFAVLGAVFGGKGEEISFQEFDAGGTNLTAASIEKLDTLVKGLYERPGLQLEIEGSIDPAADRVALQREKLRRQFQTEKWRSLRKSEQARLTAEQVELTPEEYAAMVGKAQARAATAAALTGRTNPPAATNAPATARPSPVRAAPKAAAENKGATALLREARPAEAAAAPPDIEGQLLSLIEITEADFAALRTERAKRVKEYILGTGKVEAERVFLREAAEPGAGNKGSRVYLHLQ